MGSDPAFCRGYRKEICPRTKMKMNTIKSKASGPYCFNIRATNSIDIQIPPLKNPATQEIRIVGEDKIDWRDFVLSKIREAFVYEAVADRLLLKIVL